MRIVLVSCVKKKEEGVHRAMDLYISPLFRKAWAYAQTLQADRIYILSAKYGLTDPEQLIEKYDVTLGRMSTAECRAWAQRVLEQMEQAGINPQRDEFIILAGRKYYRYLLCPSGIRHYALPYEGCTSIGKVLQFLNGKIQVQREDPSKTCSSPIPVHSLRALIQGKQLASLVDKTPGVYVWWFKESAAKQLLVPLKGVDWHHPHLQRRTIDGEGYVALYFGISRDLRGRITWHVAQRHTTSAVSRGFLSTLRLTLSALLALPASQAEQAVNDFIDKNCLLSFRNVLTLEDAEREELTELSTNYYPLNLQGNKKVDFSVRRALRELRKTYRK